MINNNPEIGQLLTGNPWGEFDCPHWCTALVHEIVREIERVFWNKNQRKWDHREDPRIPGIEFRPYYWGDDETEAYKSNLAHGNIEVRWYKHPGRGMSLNVDATTEQIISWFDAVIRAICDHGNGVLDPVELTCPTNN